MARLFYVTEIYQSKIKDRGFFSPCEHLAVWIRNQNKVQEADTQKVSQDPSSSQASLGLHSSRKDVGVMVINHRGSSNSEGWCVEKLCVLSLCQAWIMSEALLYLS